MVPFKDIFTGATKSSFNRAVSCQRCVRAGGKHNDLDNKELDFVILDSGLLITSQKKARSGWERHHNEEKPMAIWEWWKD